MSLERGLNLFVYAKREATYKHCFWTTILSAVFRMNEHNGNYCSVVFSKLEIIKTAADLLVVAWK